jgi:propionyl-CoA carboxylase beta chain
MDKIEQLKTIKEQMKAGGGSKKIEAQHAKGKFTARERIEQLVDKDSFVESDAYMTCRATEFNMESKRFYGDGVVTGTALIEGRQVWISSQDFTILGGSLGEQHAERISRAQQAAIKTRSPFIQINDSGGARIQEGVYSLDGYGKIFRNNILSSGVIPQFSLILGPCAGGAAYSPALTDFIYMVDSISQMYITGPDVIKAVTGEVVSHQELGGAKAHGSKSGNVHFTHENEKKAFEHLRKLISYLPLNNMETPPITDSFSKPISTKIIETIMATKATKPYDMHQVIEEIFDKNSFIEVQKDYAKNILVGFARLAGRTIGLVANQPSYLSGTLDIDSSDKGARFIRFCDAFNIPIISLVDVPGYMPGTKQEFGGIIRHGAKMLYAIGEATVPKIAIVLRKAFGGAYIAMASRSLGYDRVIVLPTSEIAVMGAEGAANIIFRKEIAQSQSPEQTRIEKIQEFKERAANPYIAAASGMVDEILEPNEIRSSLIRSIESLSNKCESRPEKKHGNMPL